MSGRRPGRIAELVDRLGLQPHPEGGGYRETWRRYDRSGRPLGTAIYYLLGPERVSRLHRLAADEIWHLYEGGPLRLHLLAEGGTRTRVLGPAGPGSEPQRIVPAGVWFGAELEPGVQYALVGCTMAPGFEFESFEPGDRAGLLGRFPGCAGTIARLTPDPERNP